MNVISPNEKISNINLIHECNKTQYIWLLNEHCNYMLMNFFICPWVPYFPTSSTANFETTIGISRKKLYVYV